MHIPRTFIPRLLTARLGGLLSLVRLFPFLGHTARLGILVQILLVRLLVFSSRFAGLRDPNTPIALLFPHSFPFPGR